MGLGVGRRAREKKNFEEERRKKRSWRERERERERERRKCLFNERRERSVIKKKKNLPLSYSAYLKIDVHCREEINLLDLAPLLHHCFL